MNTPAKMVNMPSLVALANNNGGVFPKPPSERPRKGFKHRQSRHRWTPEEIERVRLRMSRGGMKKLMAEELSLTLDRTYSGVIMIIRRIELGYHNE